MATQSQIGRGLDGELRATPLAESTAIRSGGAYIDAGGVRTYYEVIGEGPPVLMLHGGFGTVESWTAQVDGLASTYRVYLPERRGHGRTPDVAGPITYERMAADTAAFIDAVGASPAHVIGWSDGAVVAALLALQRPESVRKLVLIGQYFNPDGQTPGARALFEAMEKDPPAEWHGVYDRVSPDGPGHFRTVLAKMLTMFREEPRLQLVDLASIKAPTLVLQGDNDIVRVEASATLVAVLPNAQLAVVPGASHMAPVEKPELVNRLLQEFLAEVRPAKAASAPSPT